MVQFDKIGSGAFFWSLPSMGYQNRKNLIENQEKHISELDASIKQKESEIETAK